MYRLVYTQKAISDLSKLDKKLAKRIHGKLFFFSQQKNLQPFCKVLNGLPGRFRFKVGSCRIIFRIDASKQIHVLVILKIKHRKDIYDL